MTVYWSCKSDPASPCKVKSRVADRASCQGLSVSRADRFTTSAIELLMPPRQIGNWFNNRIRHDGAHEKLHYLAVAAVR